MFPTLRRCCMTRASWQSSTSLHTRYTYTAAGSCVQHTILQWSSIIFCFQITKDNFFADVVRDILLYVTRDLSDEVCTQSGKMGIFPMTSSLHHPRMVGSTPLRMQTPSLLTVQATNVREPFVFGRRRRWTRSCVTPSPLTPPRPLQSCSPTTMV